MYSLWLLSLAQMASPKAMPSKSDVVELLYFYGKQRCATCEAIENGARKVVEMQFPDQLRSGKLLFRAVDIAQNEQLADKYEVSFSSLVIVDYDHNGNECAENITRMAFSTARTSPDVFDRELTDKIDSLLNN